MQWNSTKSTAQQSVNNALESPPCPERIAGKKRLTNEKWPLINWFDPNMKYIDFRAQWTPQQDATSAPTTQSLWETVIARSLS